MQVDAEHNVDERVFIIYSGRIRGAVVKGMTVKIISGRPNNITYSVLIDGNTSSNELREIYIFKTKVEAAYDWLGKQELDAREVLQGFLAKQREED